MENFAMPDLSFPESTHPLLFFLSEPRIETFFILTETDPRWLCRRLLAPEQFLVSYTELVQNASAANIRSNSLESVIVGNLGSQLFVYQKLKKTDSFFGLAEVLSDKIYQLLENKLYPVNLLISLFPPSKDKNFEIMRQLSIVHAPDTRDSIDFPDVVTTPISRSTTPTLFRLVLNLREPKHGLIYSVHYPPNIYVKHGIDRMVYNLQQFTRIVIENPRIRLNQLPDLRNRKAASKPLNQSERNQAIMDLIEVWILSNQRQATSVFS